MTDVDALTAFIRARLDDEESWAKASNGESWRGDHKVVWTVSGDRQIALTRSAVYARHIARQDPAATLARVAALRALLTHHRPGSTVNDGDGEWVRCFGHEWTQYPCFEVRTIAAIWRGHEDYQAEWKP